MAGEYLHQHSDYPDLVRAVSEERGIAPDLVEKDYWIMHCLYGLTQQGYCFELKGGTSLSKGFGIIHRFSEDIDLRIAPPDDHKVFTGKNHNKPAHCESRKAFYDQLAREIAINGITDVARDDAFDDDKYRSGGIRLNYTSVNAFSPGLKEGVLLEVGFDQVAPNQKRDISSWALDFAKRHSMSVKDNQASGIACYEPSYTFVEKLQTIVTKYRHYQATGDMPKNFLRHYYDVYCLLENASVKTFIGSDHYWKHKKRRFPKADLDIPLADNDALILSDDATRHFFTDQYRQTRALYYQNQPGFDELVDRIRGMAPKL